VFWAVAVLALLAWIGVESRYQSCVQRAAATTSTLQSQAGGGEIVLGDEAPPTSLVVDTSRRVRAVRRCSKSPF
jgi:hypothetical protein